MEKPKKRGRKSNAEKLKQAKNRLPPPDSISEEVKNASVEESDKKIEEMLKLYKQNGGLLIISVRENKTHEDDKRIPEGSHMHAEAIVNSRRVDTMFVTQSLKAVVKNLLVRMPPLTRMMAVMEILGEIQ